MSKDDFCSLFLLNRPQRRIVVLDTFNFHLRKMKRVRHETLTTTAPNKKLKTDKKKKKKKKKSKSKDTIKESIKQLESSKSSKSSGGIEDIFGTLATTKAVREKKRKKEAKRAERRARVEAEELDKLAPRRDADSGLNVYTEDQLTRMNGGSLTSNKQGGNTALCPFDCNCCF